MTTVKIFKAGNSNVISLDRELAAKYGLELGVRVVQEPAKEGILVKPLRPKKINQEFDSWLKKTAKKYAPTLQALAKA